MPTLRSLQQYRAEFALERVKNWRRQAADPEGKYYDSLPGRIAVNGLLAVLVNDLDDKTPFPADLNAWFLHEASPVAFGASTDPLRERCADLDGTQYRLWQEEAIELSTWLKHWAKALRPPKEHPDAEAETPSS